MWRSGTRLGKRGGGGLKVELESESFYVSSEVFSDPNFVSANVRRCARAVPRPPVRPTAPSTPCSPRVPPPSPAAFRCPVPASRCRWGGLQVPASRGRAARPMALEGRRGPALPPPPPGAAAQRAPERPRGAGPAARL